jgi:D-glycero-D-manno-heptose 1,7-bisphosphate phosphatase
MPIPDATAKLASLHARFAAKELTRAQVVAEAKTAGLTLPRDFFASTYAPKVANLVASELARPTGFTANEGAANTGSARVAELRGANAVGTMATKGQRTLPKPAPAHVQVGKMHLKKLAQTDDMVLYINYIKGRPTLVYVMAQLDPTTAIDATKSFAKGRKALLLADRDGVVKDSRFLNTSGKQEAQDVMIASALAAAQKLDDAGVGLALVTNQGGYEAGKTSFEETIAINVRVSQQIANAGGHLDAIFICPFSSSAAVSGAQVDARKPSSGMPLYAQQLAAKNKIPVLGMAGDQRSDGAAAQGAGLPFFAVTDGNGRWQAELDDAKRKNETLPAVDTDPARYTDVGTFAAAVDRALAMLP